MSGMPILTASPSLDLAESFIAPSAMKEANPCNAPVPQPPAMMHLVVPRGPLSRPILAVASKSACFDDVFMVSSTLDKPSVRDSSYHFREMAGFGWTRTRKLTH